MDAEKSSSKSKKNDINDKESGENAESTRLDKDSSPKMETCTLSADKPEKEAEEVPPKIRSMVALNELQIQHHFLDCNFHKEVHSLQCKYSNIYSSIFEKRFKVVAGITPIAGGEGESTSDSDEEYYQCLVGNIKSLGLPDVSDRPGLPAFWLSVLKNDDTFSNMIKEYDEPVLVHLVNISVTLNDGDQMGFMLGFHFEANKYFSNDVLTKEYFMRCEVDMDEPYTFDGPEFYNCRGCDIQWNERKNVTVKSVPEEEKSEGKGATPKKAPIERVPSFFHFFNPPLLTDDNAGDPQLISYLLGDFEVGSYFRRHVVPRAYWSYTRSILREANSSTKVEQQGAQQEPDKGHGIKEDN